MCCLSCQSGNQAEFPAEMIIHFSGLKNLDKPGVSVYPKLLICLDCGLSRFITPETELAELASSKQRSENSNGSGTPAKSHPVPGDCA
jgi:hypothetical protein